MPGGQLIYAGVNMALHALVVQLSIQKHILTRLSSPKSASTAQAASLIHRRGLAGGGDHHVHGPPKVNFWQDPMSPSKWKEEHFVIVSLTGWGLLFYGGYRFFTKGKNARKKRIFALPFDL